MVKKNWKNPWFVAGLLLLFTFIFNLIGVAIYWLFTRSFDRGVSIFIAGFVAALLVGSTYAAKFKKVMPKKLRKDAAIMWVIIQGLISIIGTLILFGFTNVFLIMILPILIGAVILAFIEYWTLGMAGSRQLQVMKDRKK